jgi:hypothetical protein
MTARPVSQRHWRSYGNDPPTLWTSRSPRSRHGSCASPANGVARNGCSTRRALPIRDILDRMRHDGCGGRAGKVELLTGIEGTSSRAVRRIVLRAH